MLTRASKRISNLHYQQYRLFSASSPVDAFNDRVSNLKSSYPKLFNEQSSLSEQEQLLSSYKASLSQMISEYDAARKSIDASTGEAVFVELSESELMNDCNTKNKPFYNSLTANSDDIASKLSLGKDYVDQIIALQSEQANASSVEAANLKMIEVANVGDKIEEWILRFPDPLNDSSDLGLPISDQEVDEFVRLQYHHAPDSVREQGMQQTYESHKEIEEEWMKSLDDKLCALLAERNANFDQDKFKNFCALTNEMFHPHSIDHYGMSNYAKSLFRAALWQSKDRCDSVEQSIEVLVSLLDDLRDEDANIMRGVYEQYPTSRFSEFAAFQLRITDPLFAAKLIEEIRQKLENISIDRAQKDVLYDLQVPALQSERKELETELEESRSTNPAPMMRGIDVLKAEEDSFKVDVPSLDALLDEMLPLKLWQNDISGVKEAILSYATGSASLSDVDSAINKCLKSDNVSADVSALSDGEILDISVKYHNARYADVSNWNFSDFLSKANAEKDAKAILENRRLASKKLNKLGVDPLVINLVRILIEDGSATQLSDICSDYVDIMKRFRGELDGSVTSAVELDDPTFNQIKDALESANPGKKITLERLVDPGLQSGFIVKAGVQRFDFSLATVVHTGRSAVSSV